MQALKKIEGMSVGTVEKRRELLLDFEAEVKQLPQIQIPIVETVHGGLYAREATIPADAMFVGSIYKLDHIDIMAYGDITISGTDGTPKRLKGFNIVKSRSGKKRAGVTHAETKWITVHCYLGDNLTGAEIQEEITADSFEDLDVFLLNGRCEE